MSKMQHVQMLLNKIQIWSAVYGKSCEVPRLHAARRRLKQQSSLAEYCRQTSKFNQDVLLILIINQEAEFLIFALHY